MANLDSCANPVREAKKFKQVAVELKHGVP